jgi:hypothetical protein
MPEHWLISRYFRLQQFCPIAVRHAPVSWEQPCREVITHYSVLEANQITCEICTFKWQLWRLLSSKLTWLAINYSQKVLKQYLNIPHNSFRYTRSGNISPSLRILSMENINKSMNILIFNISLMINIPLSFKMFSLGNYDISVVLNICMHYLWWIYKWFLTYWYMI